MFIASVFWIKLTCYHSNSIIISILHYHIIIHVDREFFLSILMFVCFNIIIIANQHFCLPRTDSLSFIRSLNFLRTLHTGQWYMAGRVYERERAYKTKYDGVFVKSFACSFLFLRVTRIYGNLCSSWRSN